MFGFLEVILQTPLPSNNSLFNKLTSFANLSKFCKRIRADHFPDKKTSKKKKQKKLQAAKLDVALSWYKTISNALLHFWESSCMMSLF